MFFNVGEELRELGEIFKSKKETLYIVGGYIRNKLIGVSDIENTDIDLCSSVKPLDVEKILKNTNYKVENINNDFGVIKIIGKNGKIYEHATFRKEKYKFAGVHNPSNIEFIKDLETDALRRDFTCNSIYYDIYNDEIYDPLQGLNDIKNKIIRTTREPRLVFNDDSERILRLVRQTCTLGFDIDEETYNSAKNNVFKIKYLSKNRLKSEFEKILNADNIYNSLKTVNNKKRRGIFLLQELNILEYILPMLSNICKLKYIDDKGNYLFHHIINVLNMDNTNSLELKYSILMHDYGKAKALYENNNFLDYKRFNKYLIEVELGLEGLNYSREFINKVTNIINKYNIKLKNNYQIRKFIIENYDIINEIILLKTYINIEKFNKISKDIIKLKLIKKEVEKNYPQNIKNLNITTKDIFEIYPNFNKILITEMLNYLFDKCIKNYKYNNNEKLRKILIKKINKNKKYYLEV